MVLNHHLRVLFIFITLSAVVVNGDWWMEQPYEDDSFNVRAPYLEDITLECEDNLIPGEHTFQNWILPDLRTMRGGDRFTFRTLDGTAAWEVTTEGKLNITLVQEEHFGFYHCVVEADGVLHVSKVGLNYKGAYFTDLWEKYKINVLIASCSSLGFLLIVLVVGLINYFCCKSDTKDSEAEENLYANGGSIVEAYDEDGVMDFGKVNDAYDPSQASATGDDMNDKKVEDDVILDMYDDSNALPPEGFDDIQIRFDDQDDDRAIVDGQVMEMESTAL